MTDAADSPIRIAVLTSGGDAPGMNAAVRAVARTAMSRGAEVFAVYEGYQGLVDGGDGIRRFTWNDAGNILGRGGTAIGTFRSKDFRTHEGRVEAAKNLVERGIDRLVVIGGDGSLSGLDVFRSEWPAIMEELADAGRISAEMAAGHSALMIAGLVGSIDNDLVGTDSTIGADSALHRIVDAIDAITATAASHQRCFVIEVMGRHCGYLALMSAIAGGADYVLIPELPPTEGWEEQMCAELRRGRSAGRRESIVVVAEGARDRRGEPITSEYVRATISRINNEEARLTNLGHVQRGGKPSAYDRWASTWLGYSAALEVLTASPASEGMVLGIRGSDVVRLPLAEAVAQTRRVPELIAAGDYEAAMGLRNEDFTDMARLFEELTHPHRVTATEDAPRVAVLHAGGLAPGMNTAARAAVRLGIARGYTMLGVQNGFTGLLRGAIGELGWEDVEGWTGAGGAELGLRRDVPSVEQFYAISRALEDHRVDALVVIGGWNAYQAAYLMQGETDRYPAFRIPIVCVPATIDNNLPGSEETIGADSALNEIVDDIDRIKQSGAATTRAFVVEVMGRQCGYLALMGGLAGGAERIYLNEDGISLDQLNQDVRWLRDSFGRGRRLFLAVRSEMASSEYTTDFLGRLFRGESHGLYDVRTNIIGHVQQGGEPSPADRLLATRMAAAALDVLAGAFAEEEPAARYIGLSEGRIKDYPLAHMAEHANTVKRRPRRQWWMQLRPIVAAVGREPSA
ncbi:6-phosphofructokinase [Propionibacterium australiense]|uniref:6-phosphofructokinase n=1 Tax=Propionibacterium australiense TaxID=119981 RepID=A0A383S7E3_9ACTN|nr:6-phosphofructokinase [Propionibacterium australiense]RLP08509.1 6-phosphofructokinase [Propionibacterium australiense]RLP08577.1 6-phosphofructokinase [Propionibacterium australiense]SYZ33641.1 6-phosphofructokinase [Propionibacterium australiense]VEH88853.1 6-phosphofructokinase [Propionibacterium australiense]